MAPWTSADTVSSVRQLMTSVGQRPITLKKEVRGFIQPRLQYAAIQECLRLVRVRRLSFIANLGLKTFHLAVQPAVHCFIDFRKLQSVEEVYP